MMRFAFLLALAGCVEGGAPELTGVGDHTAVVGVELRVELDGTDPDGDRLTYGFSARDLPDLAGRASISIAPSGAGVFRWTPLAADLGEHAIDFTVDDGETEITVTVQIAVVNSVTSPVFRAPLGSGTTLDLDENDCLDLDVVIEDSDTAEVVLTQVEPAIVNASLDQFDGQTAKWHWCPADEQRAVSRHTLVLAADDGQNPATLKNYVIILRGGADTNPDPVCADDANEEDDDDANARATTFPSFSSTANAICGGDDDRFKVPLFTGEKMIVNLTFTQSNPQEDLDLHLFKDGVDLTPCDETSPQLCTVANGQSADSNEHSEFTVPSGCAPCDFFVVVRGFNGSAAPYAIAIEIQ